jgi:SAM-dependent methyltransferase
MTAAGRWLAAIWPVVRGRLPPAPARVLELGCGRHGGFVPMLRSSGYDAIGIDPEAPEGDEFVRDEFERVELGHQVDAVVASTSLHHVGDPAEVLDRITSSLVPGGALVVVEWDWERFDEPTARWCFERLGPDDEPGWLHRRRDEWTATGRPWTAYLQDWTEREGIHPASDLLRLLDERFRREHVVYGPYVFADLAGISPEDELAAIEAGEIQAMRVDYVGTLH